MCVCAFSSCLIPYSVVVVVVCVCANVFLDAILCIQYLCIIDFLNVRDCRWIPAHTQQKFSSFFFPAAAVWFWFIQYIYLNVGLCVTPVLRAREKEKYILMETKGWKWVGIISLNKLSAICHIALNIKDKTDGENWRKTYGLTLLQV